MNSKALEDVARAVRDRDKSVRAAQAAFEAVVKSACESERVVMVARAAGLSRGRVYQILKGQR